MLHVKPWPRYATRKMMKWSIPSTGTFRAESMKETMLRWVIVDRLTNVAHFIPIKTTYSRPQLAELYMSRIVCLHSVPKKIVSDRGTQFTSKF
jgi:hypothetical protein